MAYQTNYIEQLNNILLKNGISINMPEHKFKKTSDFFNLALREVYDNNKPREVKMYYILLSISEYFDMEWLKENVLDTANLELIESELIIEFNVKHTRKRSIKETDA